MTNWCKIENRRRVSWRRCDVVVVVHRITLATLISLWWAHSLWLTDCTHQLAINGNLEAQLNSGEKVHFTASRGVTASAPATTSSALPMFSKNFARLSTDKAGDEVASSMRRRQVSSSSSSSSDSSNLNEYLDSLPISSVGQEHTAIFECDVSASEADKIQLVWLKLVNNKGPTRNRTSEKGDSLPNAKASNDISPLSLNKRIITPDKRFKVYHRPPSKWVLTIDNVGPADDKAYYLCQATGPKQVAATAAAATGTQASPGGPVQSSASVTGDMVTNFVGGAQLNVLVAPKIVESETSANLVQVNEYEQLKLACKVVSEPQSLISWRREDGKSLDGLDQRFKHQLDRSQPHQLLSIDSSELVFETIRREQAGAYLCIASNGVQTGVSKRISVLVDNCRESAELSSKSVPCDQSANDDQMTDDKRPLTDGAIGQENSTGANKEEQYRVDELQQQQQQQQQLRDLPLKTNLGRDNAITNQTTPTRQVQASIAAPAAGPAPAIKPRVGKLTSMSTSGSVNKLKQAGNDLWQQQQQLANRRADSPSPSGNQTTTTTVDRSRPARLNRVYHNNKNDRVNGVAARNNNSNRMSLPSPSSSSSSSSLYQHVHSVNSIQNYYWPLWSILLVTGQQLTVAIIYTLTGRCRHHWSASELPVPPFRLELE